MNRRTFSKTVGVALFALVAGISSLGLTGCSATEVFDEILNWIPVGLNAFSGIVSLIAGATPLGATLITIVGTVNTAFAQLKTDIAAYQAINPPPAGALDKIKATLGIIVANFENFLQSVSINDSKLASTVTGLASIFLAAIAGFQNAIPSTSAATSQLVGKTVRINGQTVGIGAKKYSVRSFTKEYNSIAHKGGQDQIKLPESMFEKFT